jgi:hypothetical protein
MRCSGSDQTEFCPICREELGLGLYETATEYSGSLDYPGIIDIVYQTREPWTDPQPIRMHCPGGGSVHLPAFVAPAGHTLTTFVDLEVVGSSIPKPWIVSWTHLKSHATRTRSETIGSNQTLRVGYADRIELHVRHDRISGGIFSADQAVPECKVTLIFDQKRQPPGADLLAPKHLQQSIVAGSHVKLDINPATGGVTLSDWPVLAARNLGFQSFPQLTNFIAFELVGTSPDPLRYISDGSLPQDIEEWRLRRVLPPGDYVWNARAEWRDITSQWVSGPTDDSGISFVVEPIQFDQVSRPPFDPFDLEIEETAAFPPTPVGLRASSWHPNDGHIRFEFELRTEAARWEDRQKVQIFQTTLRARDQQNLESVAVTDSIQFNRSTLQNFDDLYHWRVRAIGEDDLFSGWVAGRPFRLVAVARDPQTLREFEEILNRLNPRMLDPRSPTDVPRLFVLENLGSNDISSDLATLKKLETSDRIGLRDQEPGLTDPTV